jgi:hypothetical protein
MASRYIESVADLTGRQTSAPTLKAGTAVPFVYRRDIDQIEFVDPDTQLAQRIPAASSAVQTIRRRATIAEVNAGFTLLSAIPGMSYRMVSATAIAVGGAAGAVTTVDILGTLSSSRKLVAFAQASLTQSAVLKDGGTGATVLADGASYTANDVNTAITVGITGAAVTTATHIDFQINYVLESSAS